MAQDLNLIQETVKPKDPQIGQFWRDTVNGDVLKVLDIDTHELAPATIPYVRCACYPRGEYYMGIQEMKVVHFGTPRFQKVGWFKSLWYKLKLRRSQPLA